KRPRRVLLSERVELAEEDEEGLLDLILDVVKRSEGAPEDPPDQRRVFIEERRRRSRVPALGGAHVSGDRVIEGHRKHLPHSLVRGSRRVTNRRSRPQPPSECGPSTSRWLDRRGTSCK